MDDRPCTRAHTSSSGCGRSSRNLRDGGVDATAQALVRCDGNGYIPLHISSCSAQLDEPSSSQSTSELHTQTCAVVAPGRSPSKVTRGSVMPRDLSVEAWATRIFEAATIFMAFVIFWMFCTDLICCLTARAWFRQPGKLNQRFLRDSGFACLPAAKHVPHR